MARVFEMVNYQVDQTLQSIANKISRLSPHNGEKKDVNPTAGARKEQLTMKKDVVLFFSFDVVNSTAYKTVNYFGWAQVLNRLFKELREEVGNKISGSEMWRVLGDEAIFIVKIRSEDALREYINKIFRIMVSTIYKIKTGTFFDSEDLSKLQNILSLKAAAWIAIVTDLGDINNKKIEQSDTDNIFERYKSSDGREIFEFLGNDIDTGFRISTQTLDGRMVLSYDLAYLISQRTESLSHLHIITYKKLKGVWKNKLYPIIWYHDSKAYLDLYRKEIPFEDSFTFDACDENELVKEYYNNISSNGIKSDSVIREKKMYDEPNYALNKILQDRGLTEKIDRLQQLIKDATTDQTSGRYLDVEYMQIHCVAVCYKCEENDIKILVAKRQETREKHQGQWEFGCAKAVIDKSFAQRIKEEYWQDFKIRIEPVLDQSRSIKEPIPLALYQVEHNRNTHDTNKKDKGIITLAKITDNFDPKDFHPTTKHESVQWITEQDLPNINTTFEKHVPDFEQTLRSAFSKIKSLERI